MSGLEAGMRTDEELLQPSGDDVGGPAAEDPSHLGAGAGEYQYQPLLSKNHIRLLLIEPLARGSTEESQPICATLHQVEFDSGHLTTRPYRALSYEWGAPPKKDEDSPIIILEGHAIRIRKNLYNALKNIRYFKSGICDSGLWLWVDALCINQSDVQERGHQVRLMQRIYETAEMVLVWLGMGDEFTNAAMKVLNLEADEFQYRFSKEKLPLDRDELRGIRKICEMGYWRRVWILQEVVLARNYLVICNQDFVSMEKFERALAVLSKYNGSWAGRRPIPRELSLVQTGTIPLPETAAQEIVRWRNIEGKKLPLIGWLRICLKYGFGATDPRDYVYALLGVSDDCEGKIEPDYSKSAKQVYSSTLAITGMDRPKGYDGNCWKGYDANFWKGYDGNFCGSFAELMGLRWRVGTEVWDKMRRKVRKQEYRRKFESARLDSLQAIV